MKNVIEGESGLIDVSDEVLSGQQLKDRISLRNDFFNSQQKPIPVPTNVEYWEDTLVVEKDNFRGELEITYFWMDDGKLFAINTGNYKITRLNGQSGGNKANINYVIRQDFFNFDSRKSPDAMFQDGQKHGWGTAASIKVLEPYNAFVTVQFIFDKSGGDPSGTVTKEYKLK